MDASRLTHLRRWLAVCWLALIASTWRLWTPQVVFPQIPFFGWLRDVPGWVDWAALAGMVIGLVGLLFAPARRTASEPRPSGSGWYWWRGSRQPLPDGRGSERSIGTSALLAVGSTTLLVLLNQHRFQPWAYQLALVALVLAFVPASKTASLLRLLTIGIYFWSAVSKLDYTFLHTLGPELLRGLLRSFQLEPKWMRPEVATALAWAFPLDELAVALLLAFRRTRTFGLVAAVAMHLLLIATMGPWGLNHSWGVLLWNAYFVGQDVLLFRQPARGWSRGDWSVWRLRGWIGELPRAGRVAATCALAAVTLPALEPFGLLDQWPGWAVYAPGIAQAGIMLDRGSGREPPEPLARYASYYRGPRSLPVKSRLDLWSLDALSAPLYPQSRFSLGVSIALIERYELEDSAFLIFERRASRFSGQRPWVSSYRTVDVNGKSRVRDAAERYWLNALPRDLGPWGRGSVR